MFESIEGRCHCGNIRYTLRTSAILEEVVARACDCSFCRLHGARTWSDPQGEATITVTDPGRLQRYRFATGSTEFLICRTCGAYAGAIISEGGKTWATLNLRLTGHEVSAESVHYGAENVTSRFERRKEFWTPTRIVNGVSSR